MPHTRLEKKAVSNGLTNTHPSDPAASVLQIEVAGFNAKFFRQLEVHVNRELQGLQLRPDVVAKIKESLFTSDVKEQLAVVNPRIITAFTNVFQRMIRERETLIGNKMFYAFKNAIFATILNDKEWKKLEETLFQEIRNLQLKGSKFVSKIRIFLDKINNDEQNNKKLSPKKSKSKIEKSNTKKIKLVKRYNQLIAAPNSKSFSLSEYKRTLEDEIKIRCKNIMIDNKENTELNSIVDYCLDDLNRAFTEIEGQILKYKVTINNEFSTVFSPPKVEKNTSSHKLTQLRPIQSRSEPSLPGSASSHSSLVSKPRMSQSMPELPTFFRSALKPKAGLPNLFSSFIANINEILSTESEVVTEAKVAFAPEAQQLSSSASVVSALSDQKLISGQSVSEELTNYSQSPSSTAIESADQESTLASSTVDNLDSFETFSSVTTATDQEPKLAKSAPSEVIHRPQTSLVPQESASQEPTLAKSAPSERTQSHLSELETFTFAPPSPSLRRSLSRKSLFTVSQQPPLTNQPLSTSQPLFVEHLTALAANTQDMERHTQNQEQLVAIAAFARGLSQK